MAVTVAPESPLLGQAGGLMRRLYESRGFVRCGPVLDYPESKWSGFYEEPLAVPIAG